MMLRDYFAEGTGATKTSGRIGMEIETDFVLEDGKPISDAITKTILARTTSRPKSCAHKLELGRQKIELAIAPQASFPRLLAEAQSALHWLYSVAAQYGAKPLHAPRISSDQNLLYITEERDWLWASLDGQEALEHLCRCSSVQFTVDVNPADAISWINRLWGYGLHQSDYALNDQSWRAYINDSKVPYRQDRYGGPESFTDLGDYAHQLSQHQVVMHQGLPCNRPVLDTPDLDIDLFLRSVWWHYRLRRYGDTLALEIRPLARRDDSAFTTQWEEVRQALEL